MFCDEVFVEDVLHVASIEKRVRDAIDGRVHFRIFDGLGHIFDADDLTRLMRHKIGYRPCTRVEVVN